MKKVFLSFTLLLMFSVIGLAFSTNLAEASSEDNTDASLSELIITLQNDGSEHALEQLDKINNLSEIEKNELDEILSDPDKLIEELNDPKNQATEMEYRTIEPILMIPMAASGIKKKLATATSVLELKGVELVKYEINGAYEVKDGWIHSAGIVKGFVVKKYLAGLSTEFLNGNGSILGNLFEARAAFSYDLGVGKWGIVRLGVIDTGFYVGSSEVPRSFIKFRD